MATFSFKQLQKDTRTQARIEHIKCSLDLARVWL